MVVGRTTSITCKQKKRAVQNKATNNGISNYLNISEMENQLSLAAHEVTFAYHTVVHNNFLFPNIERKSVSGTGSQI
jgi:hypothetical protein